MRRPNCTNILSCMLQAKLHDVVSEGNFMPNLAFVFSGRGVSSSGLAHRPTATRKTKLVMIPTTRADTAKIGIKVSRPASLCQIGPEATGYPQKNYFRCQLFDQSFCANGVLRSERKRRIPTRLSARAAIDLGAPKEDSGDHTTFFFCF